MAAQPLPSIACRLQRTLASGTALCDRLFTEPEVRKAVRRVMDGEDFRAIAAQVVDETVGTVNQFPNVAAAQFGYDTSGLWEVHQAFERLDDTGGDDVRITRRVGGNVGVDLLEVADGARRPD